MGLYKTGFYQQSVKDLVLTTGYWWILGKEQALPSVLHLLRIQQFSFDSFKPMVTQMVLAKLSRFKSNNNIPLQKSWCGKVTFWEEGYINGIREIIEWRGYTDQNGPYMFKKSPKKKLNESYIRFYIAMHCDDNYN